MYDDLRATRGVVVDAGHGGIGLIQNKLYRIYIKFIKVL